LKAIEVIAFLNGLETSWLLNPTLQRATMTDGMPDRRDLPDGEVSGP
jgi:hypothetical protein